MFEKRLGILEDGELITGYCKDGNPLFFAELFKRYKHLLLGVCLKYLKDGGEAEDAVMEIFEKGRLDIKRMEIVHFKPWIYTVARNHCLMKLRKKSIPLDFLETLPIQIAETEGEEPAVKELLLQKLEHSLLYLKKEQKTCLTMFYLEDLSYKQILQRTGFTLNEIKSHIQNGKANLRKLLIKTNGEE